MKLLILVLAASVLLAGLSFAATNDCVDGTKYFQCSTKAPGYICGPNGLEPYVDLCPCSNFPGYVKTGEGETATCVLAKCTDGTESGKCSATKPKQCSTGALIDNATACGCPSGKKVSANGVFCEFIPCKDGTYDVPESTCSPRKAKKCVNGQLTDAANDCGCPSGATKVGDKCEILCTDGTKDGECASTKPKQCINGLLVNKGSVCGCPSGQTLVGDQCTSSVVGGGGADTLGGPSGDGSSAEGGANALACCCMPTALIGLAGGFVFYRRKK